VPASEHRCPTRHQLVFAIASEHCCLNRPRLVVAPASEHHPALPPTRRASERALSSAPPPTYCHAGKQGMADDVKALSSALPPTSPPASRRAPSSTLTPPLSHEQARDRHRCQGTIVRPAADLCRDNKRAPSSAPLPTQPPSQGCPTKLRHRHRPRRVAAVTRASKGQTTMPCHHRPPSRRLVSRQRCQLSQQVGDGPQAEAPSSAPPLTRRHASK
jgi:hypothetical protein